MAPNGVVEKTGAGLIVSFGEMLIDFVPTVSGVSLAEAPGFLKAPGGAPANVAIAVARLGGKAAFVGKLGDDEFGHMLAGILRENGVVDEGINFDKGARTALAFVTLRADGEREFMFYRNPSADMLLTPDELNLDLIRSVSFSLSLSLLLSFSVCANFGRWGSEDHARSSGCGFWKILYFGICQVNKIMMLGMVGPTSRSRRGSLFSSSVSRFSLRFHVLSL